MKNLTALILTCLFVLSGCGRKLEPEESCNFVQNSQLQRVSWKGQLPVELYIHESVPMTYYPAVLNAMAKWEYEVGQPVFKLAGVIGGSQNGGEKDGRNVIYYSENWDSSRPREQGRTTIYWLGDMITEADINLNAENFSFFTGQLPQANKVDMDSLVVHELGHVLGLQHNDAQPSVMATTLGSSIIRREPKPADVDSFKCEYN